jgi:hypothetical protein
MSAIISPLQNRRLYEIIARDDNGNVVHHWITTSCIAAMTQVVEWCEAYKIGLYSSVVSCTDIPYIQTIK